MLVVIVALIVFYSFLFRPIGLNWAIQAEKADTRILRPFLKGVAVQASAVKNLLFELTFKYFESNNHIPGVKLLIPTTVQIGGVPGAAVLMTTGPPMSAYCIQAESHFWISN
jgi:hypothetical protein